jgi:hypothetical protein
MRFGTLINMFKQAIFLAVFALSFPAKADLVMIDDVGDLALSTDSIEIKSKDGQKIVQGVVYGLNDGIKRGMAQFIATCGELGGTLKIKGYEQESSIWVVGGKTRADVISGVACSLPNPDLVKTSPK